MPTAHAEPAAKHGSLPFAEALPWTRNDALVAVGAAALDLIGFTLSSQDTQGFVPVAGCLLMTVSGLALLARRRAPVLTFAAVLALGLSVHLSWPVGQGLNASMIVALYSVVRVRGAAVYVPAVLASAVLPLAAREPWSQGSLLKLAGNGAAVLFVVAAGLVMNRWQREVDAHRGLLAERAVADERRRIAREMHDIVAHHVTTMQLMAGGARANLDRNPEIARDALVTLEGLGRTALHEMRELLDVLRADGDTREASTAPQPGIADLDRIVAESCEAGMPTEFDVRGAPRQLPGGMQLTVFRVVQEALTNARKHGGSGAHACVRLTYADHETVVDVRDDGEGAAGSSGSVSGSGYGLIGMRERVALHGGSLWTGRSQGRGYRVTARLPLPKEEGALR
ncbi:MULTISPECIES: sensor histidine kinase [Streptomyces]|nr:MULTISPECIES: sensor histidine kinase [Streptomyces]NDZ62731.1 sensor histidine kinase [Streptomyces cyaneofuscatus]ONI52807.1 Nitrate/nitrite sensor protein NarX [Streptomyces sp. IB2014 011-1]RDV51593.1 sensor histidine kinase [Streptomyces sp. IB2014 011-12]